MHSIFIIVLYIILSSDCSSYPPMYKSRRADRIKLWSSSDTTTSSSTVARSARNMSAVGAVARIASLGGKVASPPLKLRGKAVARRTASARRVVSTKAAAAGGAPPKGASERRLGKETLSMFLFREEAKGNVDNDLAVIINSIAVACKKISNLVATAPIRGLVGLAGSSNESGDEQKKLDVISNDIFCECIRDTARSSVVVTEEEDVPVGVDAISGDYIVTFDPIDGSSNIDAAVPTGSIFGIYSPGECVVDADDDAEAALEKCVLNTRKSGEELVCAG